MRCPYTYLVTEKDTGKRYYGARYAHNCDTNDLGITYFTSSKLLKGKIKKHPDNFIMEVRQTFDNAESARDWESKLLHRIDAASRSDWYNQSNASNAEFRCKGHSTAQRKKWSKTRKGKGNAFYGRHHTDDTKEVLRHYSKNRPEESNKSISETLKKFYSSPEGKLAKKHLSEYNKAHPTRGMLNKHHSKETKEMIRDKARRENLSPETISKMSEAQRNKPPISEETRAKLRANMIGKPSRAKGKKWSAEARRRYCLKRWPNKYNNNEELSCA